MTSSRTVRPTVFTEGWIYTGDEASSRWGGLVVADGRIVSTDPGFVDSCVSGGAEVVELGGRMLLPGFQDAHVHPIAAGVEMLGCDLSATRTAAEALRTIAEYATRHLAAGGVADARP